ncbi:hypothetical protein CaCOL14_004079 [Colletotrichum acutatum]
MAQLIITHHPNDPSRSLWLLTFTDGFQPTHQKPFSWRFFLATNGQLPTSPKTVATHTLPRPASPDRGTADL